MFAFPSLRLAPLVLLAPLSHLRCVHCIDGRFKHHKQINCDVCSEPLKKTSWSPLPIEEQRFQSEVANRQEANRMYVGSVGEKR